MRHRGSGMTLIEVLVALAVVALALLALARSGAGAIRAQDEMERQSMALWVASNALAAARLESSLGAGQSRGRTRLGEREWYWQRRVEPAPGGQLWRIEVRVLDADDRLLLSRTGFVAR